MQPEPPRQRIVRLRPVSELRKDADLNGAQKDLRRPECKTGLQDSLGRSCLGHVSLLKG